MSKQAEKQAARDAAYQEQLRRESLNLTGKAERIADKPDPPEMRVEGQNFVVVSVVAPEGTSQRARHIYAKVRGVFSTFEAADEHCKKCNDVDPDFDVLVFSTHEWFRLPPPPEAYQVNEVKYNQDELDKIMKNHYKTITDSKKDMQKRIQMAKKKVEQERPKEIREKLKSASQARNEGRTVSSKLEQ